MHEFLSIEIEDVSGEPPIALFTVSSNIKSIQTRLSPGWEETSDSQTIPNILRMLEEQSQTLSGLPALKISTDGRVSYSQVKCPICGTANCKLNGTQARKLKGFFKVILDLKLQKYQCRECGTHFKVQLDHIVSKYAHYSKDVRNLALGYTGGRALSLGESADLTQEIAGVRPSRETIRQWKLAKENKSAVRWIQDKMNGLACIPMTNNL